MPRPALAVTDRTKLRRTSDRGRYDRETIDAILDEALICLSAKVRSGGPVDEPDDLSLPHWAGVIPLTTVRGEPSGRRRRFPGESRACGNQSFTMRERRKVCVVVASRANLARVTTVLEAVRAHPSLELQVIAAASALLDRFGGAVHVLEQAGFKPDARISLIIEGQTPATMAKSTGLGLLELPTAFEMLEPDIVVTVADRFETMATAVAAAYMNILVAHTQGGEVSGSIDESVRHAVTKLSHIHFPATQLSARRVIAMGEDPQFVFNVGCPSIDLAARTRLGTARTALAPHIGSGSPIDDGEPFLLVLQHPVTTEYGHGVDQMMATLHAVSSVGTQALVFWPNVDAGGNEIAGAIHRFREEGVADRCHFIHNLRADDFIRLMAHCACMVGNSSAALREGGFLGTPAVSIGTRQHDRECGPNVMACSNDSLDIAAGIRRQLAHGRYPSSDLFGDGSAGDRIAEVLATVDPPVQKRLHYDPADLLEPVGER